MQGLYNSPLVNHIYFQPAHQLFDPVLSKMSNQKLIQLLYGHRQVIQKLLENQNVLKTRFQGPLRLQTTDTEHSHNQDEPFNPIPFTEKPQSTCKTLNNILLKQQRQCVAAEKRSLKKGIEIISSCPIEENLITKQMQQKQEKKQHQKHPEQIKKCCETKNIIKNYGKSILMFLRRNRALVKRIIDSYQLDENEFYSEFERFRDKVNSITELKLFWTEEGNRFAKVYRIISNIYLKKYSLKHTFSSRVKNYGVHIKYRKRLLDVLKNPEDFSSIKYL